MEYVNNMMDFLEAERIVVLVFGFALLAVLLWYFSFLHEEWDTLTNIQERQDWFDDMFEKVNEKVNIYDCRRINMALFEQIISSLETSGKTLEDIDIDDIVEEALAIHPAPNKPLRD